LYTQVLYYFGRLGVDYITKYCFVGYCM